MGVRLASWPSTFTLWLAWSITSPPKVWVPPSASARGMVRPSTAFTRATSSRGLKGLTT